MNDEQKKAAEEKAASEEAEAKAKDKSKSVEELTEQLHQTRSEAKQRRLKERELEEKIAKMEEAQKAQDEAKLLEEGKLKELLDAKLDEVPMDDYPEMTQYDIPSESTHEEVSALLDEIGYTKDKWGEFQGRGVSIGDNTTLGSNAKTRDD